MKEKLKKKKKYIIAVAIFWIFIIVVYSPWNISKGTKYEIMNGGENEGVVGELTGGMLLSQKFTAVDDGLSSVALFCANYQRNNNGKVIISLFEESTDNLIVSKDVALKDVKDNEYYNIVFPKQNDSKGKQYMLTVNSVDGSVGNAITVCCGKNENENYSAELNGKSIGKALCLKTGYWRYELQILKLVMWVIIIALSFIFIWIFDKADEKTFLKLSFTLGITLIFLDPFVHPIDESTHFFRSYMISQGDFFDTVENGKIGGDVSSNYADIVETKLSLKSYCTNSELWNQSFERSKEFYSNPYMSSVIPVNHAIGAVGIFIGNMFHLPAVAVILLGRLMDYLFYVMFCYYAIKKANYYKNLFFIVATLPTGLYLAASYSIDPVLISASLLFASICLRHYFEKELQMTRKEKIALLICCVFVSSVKYLVYTPILLLFLLIPRKKFSKKEYLIEWTVALSIISLMAAMQLYLLNAFPFKEDRNGDVDVARQVEYMSHNLIVTIQNFATYISNSVLGHVQGLGRVKCISFVTPFIGIFAVFGAFLETKKYKFEEKEKRMITALLLGIFSLVFALTIVSLYVGFTPVGKFAVEGLQTRYLIPVLLFVMIPISSIHVDNHIENYEEKTAFIMSVGIMDMIARFLIDIFA